MEPYPLLHEVTGKGDPIVLVPGGLSGWLSWIPFVAPLARDRQVIRVQLRSVELAEAGAALSARLRHADRTRGAARHRRPAGLDRFDLVGWSYGGHVALAFALEYPQRVRTLTVIEPPPSGSARDRARRRRARRRARARDRSLAGKDDHHRRPQGLSRPGGPWQAGRRLRVDARLAGLGPQPAGHLSHTGRSGTTPTRSIACALLDVPVLAVKGTETTADDAAIVDDLAATGAAQRVLELPGGHACHIQNMDRFLAELAGHAAAVHA